MKFLTKCLGIMLAMAMPLCANAQNVTVKGKVVDASGEPMISVNVAQLGTTNGTVTDFDGNYSLSVPGNAQLQFTFVGYVPQTVAVSGRSTINVTLEEDSELLDDVVIIGYGTQKKSDLTGAVASIRNEDLQNRSTSDAAAALQGKVAGIQVIQASGAPGAAAEIRVRGYSSNSGNIGPLLIVDGLKVDNIQYLDPEMIESMEVLKDAASAAVYGAQAGNGVVLITTKKGGAVAGAGGSITYSGKFTRQSMGKKAEIFGAKEYIEYQKYLGNITDAMLTANNYDGTDTDWYDEVFQPSWSQSHTVSFQGGNDKGSMFTSINYVHNDGMVVGDKDVYNRLTAQINADYKFTKWFNVQTNNSIEKWSTKSVSSGYQSTLNSVITLDPLTPAYISDLSKTPSDMQAHYAAGDYIPTDPTHNNDYYGTSKYLQEATGNPLWQRDRTDSSNEGVNVRGSLAANLTPIAGLTITSRLGYTIAQSQSHSYSTPYWLTGMAQSTSYSISANVNTNYRYQWENFLNYSKTIGKNSIAVMAGMSYEENNYDNASISSTGADILKGYDENFRYIDFLTSDATKSVGNAPGRSAQLSYYGRLSYSYDNRYAIQGIMRADAYDSSKLSKDSRWGYFPSVSAGWTISNEEFFKDNLDSETFSFLKLRGSWGINGNINVLSGYKYSTSITLNGEMYQYNPSAGDGHPTYGSKPSGLANPDLKWETSKQIDLGLDARFLSNRLTLGFDYFKKTTEGLLVTVDNLPEIGVPQSTINAGKVLNSGVEIELGWKDRIGDLTYGINTNFSTLHNEVLEMHSLLNRISSAGISGLNNKLFPAFETGYPIWYFRGYKYEGVQDGTKKDSEGNVIGTPGSAIYYKADGSLTGSPTENDKQYLGEGIPDFTYGLTINLGYKNFDMSIFGTGAAGCEIYNLMVSADRNKQNTLTTYWRNSWKDGADNSGATYPDMKQVSTSWDFFSSSAAVFSGSYFKIKQIQFGYTVPKSITKKALVNNLRVYASLDDFFTITKYPGADPETSTYNSGDSRGMDSGSYPTSKKVIFGVNLTF